MIYNTSASNFEGQLILTVKKTVMPMMNPASSDESSYRNCRGIRNTSCHFSFEFSVVIKCPLAK
jgi:hypothetical protein